MREWATEENALLQFLVEHSPPRPYGYADQLWIDLRSWKPLAIWAVAITCLIVGVLMENWVAVSAGVALIVFYLWVIRGAVVYLKYAPALVSRVAAWSQTGDYSIADLATDKGLARVVIRTRLIAPILARGDLVEVIFLWDARPMYLFALGARGWSEPSR